MRVLFFVLLIFAFMPVAEANNHPPSTSVEEHTHYCPMHSEVTGMEGDDCSICGMHLVPKSGEESSAEHNHQPEKQSPVVEDKDSESVYLCPMHPHIHGEKGDNCPICGMNLAPANEEKQGNSMPEETTGNAIHIDPVYRQALGVKTGKASLNEFGRSIHAFGHIASNTRLAYAVDVRTAGWIVDLETDAEGDTVKKGDLLFTYYSPDLMSAQSDYLIGSRVGNAEQRLRLYGMDERAIAELKKQGRFLEQTPFYAPVDGTVAMLNVRKGAHVEEGGTILTLQDYSQVWIIAHLPLRDMQLIDVGTPAIISLEETGEDIKATVDFIYPVTDAQSRNGMVRLVVDNTDGRLKTDTLVNVMLMADSKERLAVPEESVLYGAQGAYVIEALGDGYFQPVMVETGITAQGMTQITTGLTEGQDIVTSAQFMIDAESNLQGGMAGMAGMDHSADGQKADMEDTGNVHKH